MADESQKALGRYFQANCLSTDDFGMFVYVTGPAIGGVPQVAKADIMTAGKYPAVGVIVEKSSATLCLVHVLGELDVSPAILTPGRPYYVGLDAFLTSTAPTAAPGIQAVGTSIDIGRLMLNVHPQLLRYTHTSDGSTTRSIASTITNTTFFAANTHRLGATVWNDSETNIFLKLGVTASLIDYTVKIRPGAYYEVPYNYIAQIDGLWDVFDPSGAARLTELTDV